MAVDNRVVIVTGAARGIGYAVASRLARDGCEVAVADVDEAGARSAAERIQSEGGGGAFAVRVDVADCASARALAATVVERTGRIDVLVNNAGIGGRAASTVEYPVEEWRRVLSVNLDGVFYCTQAVLSHMLERNYGRIINITAESALHVGRHLQDMGVYWLEDPLPPEDVEATCI